MDTSVKPDSVQMLRGSSEDSSMNDEFKATLDALLENDSDGSEPLHGASSSDSQKLTAKQPSSQPASETQAMACKQTDFPYPNQFSHTTNLPSMLPEFIYNQMYGGLTQSGNQQGSEIARRMGFAQGTKSTSAEGSSNNNGASKKRSLATKVHSETDLDNMSTAAISEDEGDRKKRRIDRNMREKERSKQITCQISALHELLEEANIDHKSDKFSTLVSVERYINQLHQRKASLDAEHKSLFQTLVSTSQAMQGGYIPATSNGMESQVLTPYAAMEQQSDSACNTFVAGAEYEMVFDQCSFACCLANVDGRFLKVNPKFLKYTGFSRNELLDPLPRSGHEQKQSVEPRNMSIFNIVRRDDMESMFEAMSEMLRRPMKSFTEQFCENEDTWTEVVEFSGQQGRAIRLSISLVRSAQGCPRFFSCVLLPIEEKGGPPCEIRLSVGANSEASTDSQTSVF